MKLLALETSSDVCGVALWLDGRSVVRERVVARGHAEFLLPMVGEVFAEAGVVLGGLDAIAFGRGPGSFTGVRIATSVAQGLAYGAGRPVVAVSDLAALAHGAWRVHGARRVIALLDARMGEIYGAAFELSADGVVSLQGEEQVAAAERLVLPVADGWFVAGPGWSAYRTALEPRLGSRIAGADGALLPSVVDVAALGMAGFAAGHGTAARAAQPVYLRDQVAKTVAETGRL